jgi:alpha-glucosidase (family GH31 glycosyl hydrolase)
MDMVNKLSYLIISVVCLFSTIVLSQEIALEFENCQYGDFWTIRDHHTGIALKSNLDSKSKSKLIISTIEIPKSGNYRLWLLACMAQYQPSQTNSIKVAIADKFHFLKINPLRAPSWRNGDDKPYLDLGKLKKGKMTISFEVDQLVDNNFLLDRFILTSDAGYIPTGYGYKFKPEIILPPHWAFGLIYGGYTNQLQTEGVIDTLVDLGYPIDAFWIDSWFWDYETKGKGPKGYLNFIGDTIAYPNMQQMWDKMRSNHIKSGIWLWNAIIKPGNEQVFDDFFRKEYFKGLPFENKDGWHNSIKNSLTGNIDFSRHEVRAYWKVKLKHFFDKGVDFFKLDRSSDADYLRASFEATQELGMETKGRGYVMSHLHSTYDPKSKLYPAKWTGDAKIAWEQPDFPNTINYAMGAFKENIMMVSDPLLGTYEYPFLSNDTGGYDYFGSTEQSEELYIRWTQFSMFNPITNLFSTSKNRFSNYPYRFGSQAQEVFKKYGILKNRLFPYIYTYAHKTHTTGKKMIQGFVDHPLQYLFGEELLVAPVYEKGSTKRSFFLPQGVWLDFESKDTIHGGRMVTVEAPLDKIPVYQKYNSIVVMRSLYTKSIEEGSNKDLELNTFLSNQGKSTFTLIEDDGLSNDYLNGKTSNQAFTVKHIDQKVMIAIDKMNGKYENDIKRRNYTFKIHIEGKYFSSVYCEDANVKATTNGKMIEVVIHNIATSKRNSITLEYK